MDTIIHHEFKDGMFYESHFSEVDFDFAKKVHRSSVMWNQDFLEKRMPFRRAVAVGKLLKIMGKGGEFHVKRTRSYNKKVEY